MAILQVEGGAVGFYVRKASDGRIDGEFSFDEVMQLVIQNRLCDSDCIIEAGGQSVAELASSEDWIPIAEFIAAKPRGRRSEPEEPSNLRSEPLDEGCPHCGEPMPPATIVCKHCGNILGQGNRERVYAGKKPQVSKARMLELAEEKALAAAMEREAQQADKDQQLTAGGKGQEESFIRKRGIIIALVTVAILVSIGILARKDGYIEQRAPNQPSASTPATSIDVPRKSEASKVRDNLETTDLGEMMSQISAPATQISEGGKKVVTWTFKDGSKFIAKFIDSAYGRLCVGTEVID